MDRQQFVLFMFHNVYFAPLMVHLEHFLFVDYCPAPVFAQSFGLAPECLANSRLNSVCPKMLKAQPRLSQAPEATLAMVSATKSPVEVLAIGMLGPGGLVHLMVEK